MAVDETYSRGWCLSCQALRSSNPRQYCQTPEWHWEPVGGDLSAETLDEQRDTLGGYHGPRSPFTPYQRTPLRRWS